MKRERDKRRFSVDKPGIRMPVFEEWCASKVLWSPVSVEVRDEDPCGSKDAKVIGTLETMEASENGHVGIRISPPPQSCQNQ